MEFDRISLIREQGSSLHEQLAGALNEAVADGRLAPGSRLPATRDLAARLDLNRGTVQKAYEMLVAAGIARARVGQGTFIREDPERSSARPPMPRPRDLAPPPSRFTDDPDWERLTRLASRPGVISLAGGTPDGSLFPVAPLQEALDAALADEGPALLQYGSSRGHAGFLEFLAQRLAGRGFDIPPDRIMAVSGSQQGLDLVTRLLVRPGDAVVVEDPTYSGALGLFRLSGARLLPVPVDAGGMDVDRLEAILARERPRLVYTIPNFHNPTGVTLAAARRARLLEICAAAGVPVVEDDSDGELAFDGPPPAPLAAGAPAGVIYLGTFSKLFFPGLRLGWVAAAPDLLRGLESLKRVADLHTPPLLQAAVARFAATDRCADLVDQVRAAYRRRRDALLSALEAEMPEGITWTRPHGGLSLMLTLPAGLRASDLLEPAVAEGVAFAPGRMFAAGRDGDSRLRLTYGSSGEDDIRRGVKRLGRAIRAEMAGASAGRRDPAAASPPPLV